MSKMMMRMVGLMAAGLMLVAFSSWAAEGDKSCCQKAFAQGKACEHPCCVAAAKDGKVCTKCNPEKK